MNHFDRPMTIKVDKQPRVKEKTLLVLSIRGLLERMADIVN